MSKAQYDIYRRKVLDLARTLVVKSSASADAVNRELNALGRTVNENDPTSWKYYLHLAGEYHWTDADMTIKSLDTLEDIPFTRESLSHHLATSREYRQFGSYYRALVDRYPDQEDLIKGILNPVDMATAIAAEDGQILYYNPDLVESNEENLIPKLERWCKVFSRRWLVRAYSLVDDLYVPAHLATMYMLIPAVVMNIRLGNCHTNYAHSYHIREYLASHQKLDWAVDYMTKKQMLWLYREIRYIERNAGKQSTFKSLVQNIMTERNLPLAAWSMRHSLEEMPEELTPRVEFERSSLNLDLSGAGVETRSVVEMLESEEIVAKGNSRVLDDVAPLIREQMEYSPNDKLQTKILESAVLDLTDASIYTLADTLLNHWLYLSHTGRYTAVLTVDNPRTGQPLVLSVQEAFIVYLYVFGKSMGLEMTNLPVIPANNVRRLSIPPRAELEGMVSSELRNPAVFDAIYQAISPVGNYISTEAFYRDVHKIHQGLLTHRWIWSTREHKDERGMVEGAALHLYHNHSCDLGSEESFDAWFTARGLDMPLFTRLECSLLADTLVSHATGANLNVTTSLREIQTAMLRIMATLSSYSIQFLQSINVQPLIITDWPMPRIGNITGDGGDHIEGVSIDVTVLGVNDEGFARDELPGVAWQEDPELTVSAEIYDRITWDINVSTRGSLRYDYKVELPHLDILQDFYPESQLSDVDITDTEAYVPIGGLLLSEAFDHLVSPHYGLDVEDITTITERWNARTPDAPMDLYLTGIRYPALLPAETTVDLFEIAVLQINAIVSGSEYPTTTGAYTLNGLGYLDAVYTATLNDSEYPTSESEQTWNGMAYNHVDVTLAFDGQNYPFDPDNFVLNLTFNGQTYPF